MKLYCKTHGEDFPDIEKANTHHNEHRCFIWAEVTAVKPLTLAELALMDIRKHITDTLFPYGPFPVTEAPQPPEGFEVAFREGGAEFVPKAYQPITEEELWGKGNEIY
jgi:hypothetical protein